MTHTHTHTIVEIKACAYVAKAPIAAGIMVWSNVETAIIIAKPQGGYMMSGAATVHAA